jgi:hypothetical protein
MVVLAGVWLAVRGLSAQQHLEQGRTHLAAVREAVSSGEVATARRSLAQARRDTAEARRLTSDPVWRVAGAVPWLGASAHAVTTAAAVADTVSSRVLPPLVAAADGVDLARLRSGSGLDLDPLARVTPALDDASSRVDREQRRVTAIDGPLLAPVRSGVRALSVQLEELSDTLHSAATASRLLPPLLGIDDDRRYLVVIQNPAEARGTGGLIGAYGILEASDGQVALREIGPNGDLSSEPRLPLDLGPDFVALYGQDPALWANANLSPHFPYAARIWLALWAEQHDEQLDGVIATDPVALGHLVGAVGPLTLSDGTKVTGDSTATFVMKEAYARYPVDSTTRQRDRLLVDLGRSAVQRVLSDGSDTSAIVSALRQSVGEGRLQMYSVQAAEEAELRRSSVGGTLPSVSAPFLSVVVNNGAANKLDVYLEREVTWELGPCYGSRRGSRVTVRLTNTAPPTGLPPYAAGRRIRPEAGEPPLPVGSNRLLVNVFTSRGSRLTGAELDGGRVLVRSGEERGLTVTGLTVDLTPGGASTVVLQFREPARRGAPRVHEQPLFLEQRTVVDAATCAG